MCGIPFVVSSNGEDMLFIFTSVNLDELTEKSNRDRFLQQIQIP